LVRQLQAAIGLAQLDKLPGFIIKRKSNFRYLYDGLQEHTEYLILPEWHEKSDPAWFAFPITIRDEAPFGRHQLTTFLENRNIETRPLFAGNLIKQPGYAGINYRSVGELKNSDLIMRGTFFIGVYPGLNTPQLDYMLESMKLFFDAL